MHEIAVLDVLGCLSKIAERIENIIRVQILARWVFNNADHSAQSIGETLAFLPGLIGDLFGYTDRARDRNAVIGNDLRTVRQDDFLYPAGFVIDIGRPDLCFIRPERIGNAADATVGIELLLGKDVSLGIDLLALVGAENSP